MRTWLFAIPCVLSLACAREPPSAAHPTPPDVASTSVPRLDVDRATPEDAWHALLTALKAADEAATTRLTTKEGLASLRNGLGADARDVLAKRADGWSRWEVRWKKRTDTRAEAMLGPEAKEHGLVFVRDDGGWRLERWSPGE
jgi:hypothetical protein